MTNSSRGVMKIPTDERGLGREHHRAGPRRRSQGAWLRNDRRHQGRGADGPARQSSRRRCSFKKTPMARWISGRSNCRDLSSMAHGDDPRVGRCEFLVRGIRTGQRGCASAALATVDGDDDRTATAPHIVVEACDGSSSESRGRGCRCRSDRATIPDCDPTLTLDRWNCISVVRVVPAAEPAGSDQPPLWGSYQIVRRRHPVRAPLPARARDALPGRVRPGSASCHARGD